MAIAMIMIAQAISSPRILGSMSGLSLLFDWPVLRMSAGFFSSGAAGVSGNGVVRILIGPVGVI